MFLTVGDFRRYPNPILQVSAKCSSHGSCQRQSSLRVVIAPSFLTAVDVLNKLASVVVVLLRKSFPDRWPSAFSDLLLLAPMSSLCLDFFLRILSALDDEVISLEFQRSPEEIALASKIVASSVSLLSQQKDGMRLSAVAEIINLCHKVLTSMAVSVPVFKLCLQVVAKYTRFCAVALLTPLAWIDINFVANERFLGVFAAGLRRADLSDACCECLIQIISKKMDASLKLDLVERICTEPLIQSVVSVTVFIYLMLNLSELIRKRF